MKLCLKIEGMAWFQSFENSPGASATIHLTDSQGLGMKRAIVWFLCFHDFTWRLFLHSLRPAWFGGVGLR